MCLHFLRLRCNGFLDQIFLVMVDEIGLKLGGCFVVEGRVFAMHVVVGIDEREDFGPSVSKVDETTAVEHFGFQCSHEGFRPGIVVRVRASRHALVHPSLVQDRPEGDAAVLAATITMEDGLMSSTA